jgi:tRNA nucleotidyltransferase/poly(A) polymerase
LVGIPKERIQKEMYKIFTSSNPSFVIYSLYQFDLLETIFQLGLKKYEIKLLNKKDILKAVNVFIIGKICYDKYKNNFNEKEYDNNYKFRYFSFLLTILFRKCVDNPKNIKNNLAFKILGNALKAPAQEARIIKHIINNYDDFVEFISKNEYNKVNVALLLKNINVINISQIILIAVSEEYIMNNNCDMILDKVDYSLLDSIFKKFYKFFEFAKNESLMDINDLKPIIDGREILTLFPEFPQLYFKEIMQYITIKQIELKSNFTKEDAINYIRSKMQELNIKYDNNNDNK